uniref:Sushi domain-containing protein n=1 Tax=Nothobranchius furzeri TaxID=105023 RepID=A0A8C6PD00_NOTFU
MMPPPPCFTVGAVLLVLKAPAHQIYFLSGSSLSHCTIKPFLIIYPSCSWLSLKLFSFRTGASFLVDTFSVDSTVDRDTSVPVYTMLVSGLPQKILTRLVSPTDHCSLIHFCIITEIFFVSLETCTAPTVDNSVQKGSVSKYFVGDIMNLTCKQGFQLNGAQTITCRPSGRWQPQPPRCVASKVETQQLTDQKVGCQAPPAASGSNVRLSNKYTFKTSFSSGDRVYYRCDVGYTSVGGSRLRMCFNGIWTPLTLICERMSCGHAGEFENGHFTYSGIHFGDKATAVCNKGYRLVGQGTRVCQSEGWDGRTPVCEVIKCEEPIKTNAARRNIQEAPYSYSNVLIYYCLEGILDGPSHIWCTENGTWSAPPPQCKVVTCPSPNVPHAFWVNGYRQKYNPNDTIDSFQCRRGYTLRGPKHITCTREGTWSPKLPSCQPRK